MIMGAGIQDERFESRNQTKKISGVCSTLKSSKPESKVSDVKVRIENMKGLSRVLPDILSSNRKETE